MKKRIFTLAMLLAMAMAVPAHAGVGVTIDNIPVNFTSATGSPVIDENGRTLVPLRATMEAFGCTVYWQESSKQAYVIEGDFSVVVPVGKRYIDVMHDIVPIDTEAKIIDGRVYLPIRAVLEAFGADVGWSAATNSVSVTSYDKKKAEEEKQRAYEERQKEIAEINRQIEENIRKQQEEKEKEEEERKARWDQIRKEQEEWYSDIMAEVDKLKNDVLENDKKMQKEKEELQQESANKYYDAMYDSISNSGGYGNTYVASQGYYNPNLYGGYGSTTSQIAYQQYLDNLLVQSRYK